MPRNELRSGYAHPVARGWHSPVTRETDRIVLPVFLTDDDERAANPSAPCRPVPLGRGRLARPLRPLVDRPEARSCSSATSANRARTPAGLRRRRPPQPGRRASLTC
jgi:hypothetical protein